MSKKRKICVVTGTRAEYSSLNRIMELIKNEPLLQLQVAVTGQHLSPAYGLTYRIIEEDGFRIDSKVEMLVSSNSPVGVAKSIGLAVVGFSDEFARLKPDIIVLVGDRYEILAAAQAAMILNIPIAHIHGGESTEGVCDEAIRHAITKMAHLHFVAAEPYRKRVIQLGEQPDKIFNFGAPALDNITSLELYTRRELEKTLGFSLKKTTFLVTYHPLTLGQSVPENAINELLMALDRFQGASIIFTGHNSDAKSNVIGQIVEKYVANNEERARLFLSLGQLKYLSAIKHSDVVIGNSSSGLTEVPALKKPTVNIGNRQQGRIKAASVIDCEESCEDIVMAIETALSRAFQSRLENVVSPYGSGNSSRRIVEVLRDTDLYGILIKPFFDIDFQV